MKNYIHLLLIALFFPYTLKAQNDTLFKASVSEVMKLSPINTLEELLNIEVTTVSNTAEKIGEAPASTIVITRKQILERGYTNVLDIFQDLPDIDLAITYGDAFQYKSYWRGNRSDLGAFFLLMLDGVIFNNLFFNEASVITAFPISAIEKIEVVYGPASATYGANAFMGVINIITQKKEIKEGLTLNSLTGATHKGMFWTDLSTIFRHNKLKISLSTRFEQGNVNQLVNPNSFYWLRDEHYANTKIWGNLATNPNFNAERFSSNITNRAVDFRVSYDKLEIALQHFQTNTASGLIYPADKLGSNGKWAQPENSAHIRYVLPLSNKFFSQSLLRYRQSYVSNDSYDTEGYNISNQGDSPIKLGNGSLMPQETARVLQFLYYSSFNTSFAFFQNFEWRLHEKITLFAGLKYEVKDLQKAYENYASDYFFPEGLTDANVISPPMPPQFFVPNNRAIWTDRGIYGQMKWLINPDNIFQVGYRYDHNSVYGSAPTVRLSFVKKMKPFIFKVFYGEAFQEPAIRLLYTNWTGSGSDATLKPERSRTGEIAINFTNSLFSHDFSCYVFDTENSIIGLEGGAKNLGRRQVWGLSYRLQGHFNLFKETNYWFNYSYILSEVEQKFDGKGNPIEKGIIGDLAPHKIQLGINSQVNKRFSLSFLGRFMASKNTIDSNPIRQVDAYFVADANLHCRIFRHFAMSLRVVNLFNTAYFHSGVRNANSGGTIEPSWTGRAFNGSKGFYNSLLPQTSRYFTLNLHLDL